MSFILKFAFSEGNLHVSRSSVSVAGVIMNQVICQIPTLCVYLID